jgi:hypothetical protein
MSIYFWTEGVDTFVMNVCALSDALCWRERQKDIEVLTRIETKANKMARLKEARIKQDTRRSSLPR